MPYAIRLLAPLLFLCACLLGFMSIGQLGQIDAKVAQITIAVCIALSVLAGVLFRYSFQSTPVGAMGKYPGVLDTITAHSAGRSSDLSAQAPEPAASSH